jgi:hypothetical protein
MSSGVWTDEQSEHDSDDADLAGKKMEKLNERVEDTKLREEIERNEKGTRNQI